MQQRRRKNTRNAQTMPHKMGGLGLLEVMLFVFVVGTLLVVGYSWTMAQQQAVQAEKQASILQQADRFIEAFASANFRLPCPADTPGGVENCAPGKVKGYVPAGSLGLAGSSAQKGIGQLRYLVNRTAAGDASVVSNSFQPHTWDGGLWGIDKRSTADYCQTLANTSTTGARVFNAANTPRAVAYAVAHAGATDADGNANVFDGRNANALAEMEAPENALITGVYDDHVIARSAAELSYNSGCDSLTSSLDMIALGVETIDEANTAKVMATIMSSILAAVGLAKTGVGIYKVYQAGVAVGGAIATLSTAASLLAGAIATCVFIVGCAEIPHAAASVAAAAAAIVSGALAVAAGAVAIALNATYVGLLIEVAVLAGTSTSQSIDLGDAIIDARASWTSATARRVTANSALTAATNESNTADFAQEGAFYALYADAQAIVAATNTAAEPDATTSIYVMDAQVGDVINRVRTRNAAQYAVEDARQELTTAQGYLPPDPAVVANKQAILAAAIANEATAGTNYTTSRQTLIDMSYRQYCVTYQQLVLVSIGPPPVFRTDTITDCNRYYDGRNRITAKIDDFTDKYNRYYTKLKALETAQQSYNAALQSETNAQSSYNRLVAVNTSLTIPGGTPLTASLGATAILERADEKGGTK